MCGIGEPRDMRGLSDSYSIHEPTGCPLEAEPKDIGTYEGNFPLLRFVEITRRQGPQFEKSHRGFVR